MKKLILAYLIIIHTGLASQQLMKAGAGLPQLTAYSRKQADIFSFTKNPAVLANLEKSGIGLYAEKKYLLHELNYYSLVSSVNAGSGGFGIEINAQGFSAWRQEKMGVAYGRILSAGFSLGMELSYNNISIQRYGRSGVYTIAVGTSLQPDEKLTAGFYMEHSLNRRFGENKQERWPGLYSMALGYDLSNLFFIGVEIEKQEGRAFSVNTWMQYRCAPQLSISAGLASANTVVMLGVTFLVKSLELTVRSSYHPQLGISPALLSVFYFKHQGK